MMDDEAIKVTLGTSEVEIDYQALADNIFDYSRSAIEDAANEAVDNYVRYEMDLSDQISEHVSDSITDVLENLLGDVNPGTLCNLGEIFKDAVETVIIHHIDMKEALAENRYIEQEGGLGSLVMNAMSKEMVVNVTFVDKQPAEVVETVAVEQVICSEGLSSNLIPGPVDEINTRSENV